MIIGISLKQYLKNKTLNNALVKFRYKKQLWILGEQGCFFSVLSYLGQSWFLGLWYMSMDLRTEEWSRPAENPLFHMASSFLFSKSCEQVWEKLEYLLKNYSRHISSYLGKKALFFLFLPFFFIIKWRFLVLTRQVDVVLDPCYPST